MGSAFSRVGSGTYYASYERKLELLRAENVKLKDQQTKRQLRRQRLVSIIFWYCTAAWAAVVAYAAWVMRQPPGTFSVRGHFLRVAPVFCWPLAVYSLCTSVDYLTGWSFRRRERRLQAAQLRMREMITTLKESTNYEKTLQLLRKYDPDFAAAEAKQRARLNQQLSSPVRRVRFSEQDGTPPSPRHLGGLAGSALRGAGSRMMPALDYLASNLMGDNPALTSALREAHSEGEALRARLVKAEARIATLEADNTKMRSRLGEDPPQDAPPSPTTPTGPEQSKPLFPEDTKGDKALEGQDLVPDGESGRTPKETDSNHMNYTSSRSLK